MADEQEEACGPPPAAGGVAPTLSPRWLTSTVLGLTRAIHEQQAFDRLPILADALEEAGCDDLGVLNHCRRVSTHLPQCWLVAAILASSLHVEPDAPPPAPPPVSRAETLVTGTASIGKKVGLVILLTKVILCIGYLCVEMVKAVANLFHP